MKLTKLGMSPFQYIRQEKLNLAKELFEEGRVDSIKEIAYSVGSFILRIP